MWTISLLGAPATLMRVGIIGSASTEMTAASVFGMAGSVVVNFVTLGIVILFGNFLLSIMPEGVKEAFNYAMPAVYGSLLIMMLSMLGVGKKKEEPKEESTEA